MPWRECSVMDERLRFVAWLLDGEGMSQVCREFGISRKTGYKIFNRYKEHGLEALTDRSRRPVRYANQLPMQIEQLIVKAKRDKPHWGAARSASCWSGGWTRISGFPPKAPFTPCSTGMAWSRSRAGRDGGRPVRRCRKARHPTNVVRRLQGRVQARQWPVLLSAHRHRPCFALPP